MMLRLTGAILWSLWTIQVWAQPTEPLRVRNGLLRGTVSPDGSYMKYNGIPYATIKERFQAAEPVGPWDGVFDATNEHITCLRRSTGDLLVGQENCLILNVYTPAERKCQLRPVMVFIHGGGFKSGSGAPDLYGPDYLMKHDIILVTINYRLEILGFLCLGIREAPGNVGLRDQVEALKWVKNNIESFGGNPDDITIFGESAGAASVFFHLLSPMSKGLFHKAIMESATAMCPWSLQFEPFKTASLLAEQMGFHSEDPKELYQFLNSQSSEKLLKTRIPRAEGDMYLSEYVFVPCVEDQLTNVEKFLQNTPYNLTITGQYNKVPIIMGYNSAEGYLFAGKENDTTIKKISFNSSLPRNLLIPTETERLETAEKLRSLYLGNMNISKETLWKFSKYIGDSQLTYPVVATVDLLLRTIDNPMYAYKFGYDGAYNLPKLLSGYKRYPGATHGDELFYLFNDKIKPLATNNDTTMVDRMTTMWTNFATFGEPIPNTTPLLPAQWLPVDKDDPQVFVINKEFSTEPLWNDKAIRYWNETYAKYRRMS